MSPGSGDDYLERAGGKPARLAFCLPLTGLDDQAGIVAAQGGGTDQDRVALGTHLVHSVEVFFVGQAQAHPLGGTDFTYPPIPELEAPAGGICSVTTPPRLCVRRL